MGNLGFQELLMLVFMLGIPALVIFLIIKLLKKNNSKNETPRISIADELEKLRRLKEKGVITKEQFESAKSRLI